MVSVGLHSRFLSRIFTADRLQATVPTIVQPKVSAGARPVRQRHRSTAICRAMATMAFFLAAFVAFGLPTTAHLSGGFGFVYMLHFASSTPKTGPWQEYKLGAEKYGKWFDPPLKVHDGEFNVPKGPGVGIADPKELLKGAVAVSS